MIEVISLSDHMEAWIARDEVIDCYELVKEWNLWIQHDHIGTTKITVRVEKRFDGRYYFTTSHAYKGSEQAGPYVSSDNSADSIEDVMRKAKRQLFSFFDKNDKNAKWVELE